MADDSESDNIVSIRRRATNNVVEPEIQDVDLDPVSGPPGDQAQSAANSAAMPGIKAPMDFAALTRMIAEGLQDDATVNSNVKSESTKTGEQSAQQDGSESNQSAGHLPPDEPEAPEDDIQAPDMSEHPDVEVTPNSILDEAKKRISELESMKGADAIANLVISRMQAFIWSSAMKAAEDISDINKRESLVRERMGSVSQGGGSGGLFATMANRIFNGKPEGQKAVKELEGMIARKRDIQRHLSSKGEPVISALSRIYNSRKLAEESFSAAGMAISDSNEGLYKTTTGQIIRRMIEQKSKELGVSEEKICEEMSGWATSKNPDKINSLRQSIKAEIANASHADAIAARAASEVASKHMEKARRHIDDLIADVDFLKDNKIDIAPGGEIDSDKLKNWISDSADGIKNTLDPVDPEKAAKEHKEIMESINRLFERLSQIFARFMGRAASSSPDSSEESAPSM